MIYDIIGDIHGHASDLIGLLEKLGYTHNGTSYTPPDGHRAIFIGDLIDRGEQEVKTLDIVFAMLDTGVADIVMGNHEYNALAYATPNATKNKLDSAKEYLRSHNHTHNHQHEAFLTEIPFGSPEHKHWLQRFYEIPLWLETEHACFVHACWDTDAMATLKPLLTDDNRLTPDALQATGQKNSPEYDALERVLKGVEMPLPNGLSFTDKDGTVRHNMRVRWWEDSVANGDANTVHRVHDIARASRLSLSQIPKDTTVTGVDFTLNTDKPVFIGHYWMQGEPVPLSKQVVCTDYSVAGKGYMTAYRFDTDNPSLDKANFVQYR